MTEGSEVIDHAQRGRDEESRMTLFGRGFYDEVPWELWALLEEDFLSVRFQSRNGGGGWGGPVPKDAVEATWFGRTGNGWRIIVGTVTKQASSVSARCTTGATMTSQIIHIEAFPFNLFVLIGPAAEVASHVNAEDASGKVVGCDAALWNELPDVGL